MIDLSSRLSLRDMHRAWRHDKSAYGKNMFDVHNEKNSILI